LLDIYIYNLLHKDHLHVSAFYNGHLQVESYTCVGCIQWVGKRWGGHKISLVLCGMSGVGTWGSVNVCYV